MNDVISAVLGEKQRVLMEALADYNGCVDAARVFDADCKAVKFYVQTDESIPSYVQQPDRPTLGLARRVAVNALAIRELIDAAIAGDRDVVIDYKDREGERTSRTVSPISWRPSRYSRDGAMLIARDVEKNELRHFRLDRIERAEDA
jgi:hypothetical protein